MPKQSKERKMFEVVALNNFDNWSKVYLRDEGKTYVFAFMVPNSVTLPNLGDIVCCGDYIRQGGFLCD